MSYVNNYTPSPPTTVPASELYGPEPYDINFAYPIYEETLRNSRTKLAPFIPAVHAKTYWAHVGNRPEVFRYYPFTLDTLADFLAWYELNIRRGPFTTCFAVIDKTRPDPEHPEWGGSMAGIVGMFYTSPEHLHTEAGYVVVFPDFQKTHIAKDMVGLLLRYVLQLPSASPPGLGLRRVKWSAHPKNIASIGLAKRMGFRPEGTAKWVWVLPDHLAKEGWPGRIGDACSGKAGRHSTVLALCWDDWEDGERERVEAVLGN
ncbi:acyl-CoA N-acyltransferase [Pilatotrama ljubarskyi]|nr:acyl-CoA N-acyltransferase [Pilatotrama ljubarskyi]